MGSPKANAGRDRSKRRAGKGFVSVYPEIK